MAKVRFVHTRYLAGQELILPFDASLWVRGDPLAKDAAARDLLSKNALPVRSSVFMRGEKYGPEGLPARLVICSYDYK